MRELIPDSYSFVQAVIPLSSLYQETVSLATDLHTSGRPIDSHAGLHLQRKVPRECDCCITESDSTENDACCMLVTRHAWLNYPGYRSVLICNPRNEAVSAHASKRCKRFIGNR